MSSTRHRYLWSLKAAQWLSFHFFNQFLCPCQGNEAHLEYQAKEKVCHSYRTYSEVICAFIPTVFCLGKMNLHLVGLKFIFCIKLYRTHWLSYWITVFPFFSEEFFISSLTTQVYDLWLEIILPFVPIFGGVQSISVLIPTNIQEK